MRQDCGAPSSSPAGMKRRRPWNARVVAALTLAALLCAERATFVRGAVSTEASSLSSTASSWRFQRHNNKTTAAVTDASSPLWALKSHPTRVTGYGSRRHKSAHRHNRIHHSDRDTDRHQAYLLIPPNQTECEALSLCIPRSDGTNSTTTAVVTITSKNRTDWQASWKDERDSPLDITTTMTTPVEGLYGVYQTAAGPVWAWITQSEPVYEIPGVWSIRRVTQLHLVRLSSSSSSDTTTSTVHARQWALTRQALKDHTWYFCETPATGNEEESKEWIVPDMTHSLQQCFLHHSQQQLSNNNNNHKSDTLNQTGEATMVTPPGAWWASSEASDDNNNLFLQPDPRFFWNQAQVQPILERYRHDSREKEDNHATATIRSPYQSLLEIVVPVTSAFVGIQQRQQAVATAAASYDQVLVTRRSRFRAGTRFTKRGADATGAVANYADSEQILVVYNNNNATNTNTTNTTNTSVQAIASHVQTRGSIPLRWSSPTDIKTYRPRVRLGTDPLAQARAVRQHLQEQASNYIVLQKDGQPLSKKHPSLVLVNLVDKKSDQGRLGRALDAVLKAVLEVYERQPDPNMPWMTASHMQHLWYDFHAQVKKGRWDRLQNLLSQVQPTLIEQGFFLALASDKGLAIESIQTGVIRTNCMDCLDRTNVVQSIFGRYMLFTQLAQLVKLPLSFKTAFRKHSMTLPWAKGEVAHRLLWADNADAISRLYAGTPALKGDFTRTGKRTKKGALDDGVNSLQRYYLNNFLDADRQEGMDLMVGHQAFSLAEQDDDEEETLESSRETLAPGWSLQEAVRRMLLAPSDQENDQGEHLYRRIKIKDSSHTKTGRSIRRRKHLRTPLDMRWLPGDLQTQMRSVADLAKDDFSSRAALEAMDRRAASDLPWWVVADSTSDQDDDDDDDELRGPSLPDTRNLDTVNTAGYVLSALVAGTRAPLTMAALVVGVLAWSLSSGSEGLELKGGQQQLEEEIVSSKD